MGIFILSGILMGAFLVSFFLLGCLVGYKYAEKTQTDKSFKINENNTQAIKDIAEWMNFKG